ncbi:MAG: ribonuclease P protein component [Planctomycetota bacterium]|nr:ribonuclease P protein component [Planctomycetota bacterium]
MGLTGYPRHVRLRRRAQFQRVLREGLVYPGRECVVRILANELGFARLGMAAPRQYGNAVRRNRFRRLVRAAFREQQEQLDGVDVFVAPRRGLREPTLEGIAADLATAPQRARKSRPRPPSRRR